jgi:hypothetical protein
MFKGPHGGICRLAHKNKCSNVAPSKSPHRVHNSPKIFEWLKRKIESTSIYIMYEIQQRKRDSNLMYSNYTNRKNTD